MGNLLAPKVDHVATTITSISVLSTDMAFVAGAMAVIALILSLVQRELAGSAGQRFRPLGRVLIMVIAPLMVVFVAIVFSRLATLI
jgi:hypothetical protein